MPLFSYLLKYCCSTAFKTSSKYAYSMTKCFLVVFAIHYIQTIQCQYVLMNFLRSFRIFNKLITLWHNDDCCMIQYKPSDEHKPSDERKPSDVLCQTLSDNCLIYSGETHTLLN